MPTGNSCFLIDECTPKWLEKCVVSPSGGIVRFDNGKDVVLTVGDGEGLESRERDSSRVHTHVLSEYKWKSVEQYAGRILAVHGNLIAYRLFNDSTGETIRVMDKESGNRHLIKGFVYPTADLQWASHAPLLAVLDCNANLYVYHVDSNCIVTKYLNVMRPENSVPVGIVPSLTWCPYIPESDEPHELIHMIAVYFGTVVELITLNPIKVELENEEEVKIERLEQIPESLIRLPEEDITSDARMVCISPDATAVAVVQDSPSTGVTCGLVSFFIVAGDSTRFAHRWQPDSHCPINELIFLDNIDVNSETPEQFWKYAVVTTEDGRRLEIFETEQWRCIGRLRIHSLDGFPNYAVSIDPSAHFLFLADYDAANVLCIELTYTSGVVPRFAACTQISFCHPLVYLAPYSVIVNESNLGALIEPPLFDEDASSPPINAWLIALSEKSVLELRFDLDSGKTDDDDDDDANTEKTSLVPESLKNSVKSRADGTFDKLALGLEKESEMVEALNTKLDNLLVQMKEQAQESEKRRLEDQAKAEGLLEQLKEEMVLRDERLLLKIGSVICENRSATVEAIQNSIDVKMDSLIEKLQRTSADMDEGKQKAINEELAKNIRGTMMSVVVPALDSVCTGLFHQLTETFRAGLEQFLRQVRNVQLEAARASSSISVMGGVDGPSLIHLIENDQISTAFERALSQNDLSPLMFVCNKVDPDTLFRAEQALPQSILLCILKKLGSKLEGETDLKFRYIENSLMALNLKEPTTCSSFRPILEYLQEALINFMAKEANSNYKRQARIILQLIVNMLR